MDLNKIFFNKLLENIENEYEPVQRWDHKNNDYVTEGKDVSIKRAVENIAVWIFEEFKKDNNNIFS